MNIFKRSAIAGLLVLSLVACGDSKEKKLEFQNKIATEMNAIQTKTSNTPMNTPLNPNSSDAEIKKYVADAKEKINNITKEAETHLDAIKKLSVPSGGEKLHKAAIEDITAAIDFLKKDTIEAVEFFATKPSPEKMMEKATALGNKAQELAKKDKEFQQIQADFIKEIENTK